MKWQIFGREEAESKIKTTRLVDIWWLRHQKDTNTIVVFNLTEQNLRDLQLHFFNDDNVQWQLRVDNIDYGIADAIPFTSLLKQQGTPFSGKLHKVILVSGTQTQEFITKGNSFFMNPPFDE